MSINDTLLVECVRAHPELYDTRHAGFFPSMYAVTKDSQWRYVAQTMNASVRDCSARWQTLRQRFIKEMRFLESQRDVIAAPEWPLYETISFLAPHIKKRKSVENLPQYSLPVSTSSPKMLNDVVDLTMTDEELSPDCLDEILEEEPVDVASAPSPVCTSSEATGTMPHCKKQKVDDTAQMLNETLAALNKSMATYIAAAPPPPFSIDLNTPDILIGQSVESCLSTIKDMQLKLKYRRKFRSLIQDCEEAAEVQHNVEEAQQVSSKMVDKSIQIHLTKPFGSETNQTEIKLVNQMTSPNHCVYNNRSRLSKEDPSEPQEVSQEDNSLPTVPETKRIFAKYIASQMKHLPKSICNLLRREIKVLVDSKRTVTVLVLVHKKSL